MPCYESAYCSQRALTLTQQCRKLIDSYGSIAALRLITLWMTSLWDAQRMPINWRPSCFSTVPGSLFSCRRGNYCHFRQQSPEALHCRLPLMRGPLGTSGRPFMKQSDTVNGPSGPPPFAGNHNNRSLESGMAVLWRHGGASLSDCSEGVYGMCECVFWGLKK